MAKHWEAPVLTAEDRKVLDEARDFTRRAIEAWTKGSNYKGLHSVFSGYNGAFKQVFPKANPIAVTTELAKRGDIVVIPRKGGVMLYLPGQAPKAAVAGSDLLAKMGLAAKDGKTVQL